MASKSQTKGSSKKIIPRHRKTHERKSSSKVSKLQTKKSNANKLQKMADIQLEDLMDDEELVKQDKKTALKDMKQSYDKDKIWKKELQKEETKVGDDLAKQLELIGGFQL
ncbi:BA75_01205T0 [Komagataella pastoris]|uniref:BA75_01205T0 n=1 Tax=Komagataella pastoris TaxID=4922 RepID=A0A1B2J6I5_PICPA|nr:BA75_01205T0 [Komagataella pastoris]